MSPATPDARSAHPPRRGLDLLHDPRWNRGTAFTQAEREACGLRGLLPPRVFTMEEQVRRVLANLARKESPLEKYIALTALQDRNETLFYRVLLDHITEMMPIVYTPTVGEACRKFGEIFRRPRGLYITAEDRGEIAKVLGNWGTRAVDVIVVTDGERILGLGDLGVQGMGIPVGKLALYTACAGIDPARCLPITLDVGTDNAGLRESPFYPGLRQPRLRGAAYETLIEEFVRAVDETFPGVVLQWEDFATENAFHLLDRYRDRLCTFNDDIQGTAAVTLAGLLAAARVTGVPLRDHRILFYGAGAAATGIGELIVSSLVRSGMPEADARTRCWFLDSKGLVVRSRTDLQPHKRPFAHDYPPAGTLDEAIRALRPSALIGVAAQPGAFTEQAIRTFASLHDRPVLFVLSNPTSKAECSADEAYRWTDGRAIFASGSPFDPVTYRETTFLPRQANNAYIFPGLGLGLVLARARRVSDGMFHAAAETLAALATDEDLARGSLFPGLPQIRAVSHAIAAAVFRVAVAEGLASVPSPADLDAAIDGAMWWPEYAG